MRRFCLLKVQLIDSDRGYVRALHIPRKRIPPPSIAMILTCRDLPVLEAIPPTVVMCGPSHIYTGFFALAGAHCVGVACNRRRTGDLDSARLAGVSAVCKDSRRPRLTLGYASERSLQLVQ